MKPFLFILMLSGAGIWEVSETLIMESESACEIAVLTLANNGVYSTCSHFDDTHKSRVALVRGDFQLSKELKEREKAEEQYAIEFARYEKLKSEAQAVKRTADIRLWCQSVELEGSAPNSHNPVFSVNQKFWPERKKPTLKMCTDFAIQGRHPVSWAGPKTRIENLRRGYK